MKSFLRFSGSSAICFLLDYGLFTLLNSVLLVSLPDGTRELCATYGARIVSAVTNFFLNRLLVFQDKSAAASFVTLPSSYRSTAHSPGAEKPSA